MDLKITYEDDDVIVIDKPAGISVHPTDRGDNKLTIVRIVLTTNPEIKNVGENPLRPGIVHRLDKETSGLMIVAKNNETFFELKKQFQERKVEKKYISLVSGALEKNNGTIEIPLVKLGTRMSASTGNDPRFKGNIRHAITEYKVIRRYKEYTFVEIRPKTGRMHQIRVHFASINHPVACDKLYGRRAKKCPPGLARHFIHCAHLKFQLKNALMEFDSELPDDLKRTLKTLA